MLEILTSVCECHKDNQWTTKLDIIKDNEFVYEVKITGNGHAFHAMIGKLSDF